MAHRVRLIFDIYLLIILSSVYENGMNFISYFVFNLFIVCVFPKKEDSQTVCDLPFEPGFWQQYYENPAMMCYRAWRTNGLKLLGSGFCLDMGRYDRSKKKHKRKCIS